MAGRRLVIRGHAPASDQDLLARGPQAAGVSGIFYVTWARPEGRLQLMEQVV